MRRAQKALLLDLVHTLAEAHGVIGRLASTKSIGHVKALLADCQNTAIQMGSLIEQSEGEGCATVRLLEDYCDALFRVYENAGGGSSVHRVLDAPLRQIEHSVKHDLKVRLEVAFFPYQASMWDSLESVWRAAAADPDCDAYVVPIPYYDIILTVDVEAFPMRAPGHYVDTLIYGRLGGGEWGIGRMMDIADKYGVKMSFFLDFAEVEFYGSAIFDAGRYILSRGHDLQLHCHIDGLEKLVKARFADTDNIYRTWYQSEAVSDFMIGYCQEQYEACAKRPPAVFRGGAYRFGEPLLKVLKKRGFAADASYNMLRPAPLPPNKQFFYENGLLELPVGVVPGKKAARARQMNFNSDLLCPRDQPDEATVLEAYNALFRDYYAYYGRNAAASLMMHSWSFCCSYARFHETGYMDQPNPYAAGLFESFLAAFRDRLDFVTMAQTAEDERKKPLPVERFDDVLAGQKLYSREVLEKVAALILEKAAGREVVVWGKGWWESEINSFLNLPQRLGVKFYIARDAAGQRTWRNRPVMTFDEARISPAQHYVFLCAQAVFPEIREALRSAGFEAYRDYFDFASLSYTDGIVFN